MGCFMNIRKIEVVLISAVTAVVFICVVAVYINHRYSENEHEDCRYYAKGVETGFSLKSEQLNTAAALALGSRADILSLMLFRGKSVEEQDALNDSYAASNAIYKAAYEDCISYR